MTPTPSGRLERTETGHDLLLSRTFRASAQDVWASVTEPDRTARWFGRWEGEPGAGRTIKVQLAFEDEQPWTAMRIDACEPPSLLGVTAVDDFGSWRLELRVVERDGVTELTLVHHLDDVEATSHTGPGWEYYLDLLVAAREDGPKPDFEQHYFPAMQAYYQDLIPR